jgi:L-malate glycosyltransferase
MFVESGQAGGGSFGSQYLLIQGLDQDRFQAVVVYLNETRWAGKIRKLNLPVFVLTDRRYSYAANSFFRRSLNRIERIVDQHFERLYVYFVKFAHRRTINALRAIIRTYQVDIVHLNNQCNRDLFGIVASAQEGIPCVCHLRSHRADGFGRARAGFVNNNVAWVISASGDTLKYWANRGIDRKRASVIYNGIESCKSNQLSNGTLKSRFQIPQSAFLFGAVGSLTVRKGHKHLLHAWRIFSRKYPKAFLLIVGDGEEWSEISKMITSLEISHSVKMVGFQEDGRAIIGALDAFVLSSAMDICSRAILEALATKTPIIASRVGGNPELVTDQESGLLFEYGDVQGLADQMEKVILNPNLRQKVSENGHTRVISQFSMESYVGGVETVYRQVAS